MLGIRKIVNEALLHVRYTVLVVKQQCLSEANHHYLVEQAGRRGDGSSIEDWKVRISRRRGLICMSNTQYYYVLSFIQAFEDGVVCRGCRFGIGASPSSWYRNLVTSRNTTIWSKATLEFIYPAHHHSFQKIHGKA